MGSSTLLMDNRWCLMCSLLNKILKELENSTDPFFINIPETFLKNTYMTPEPHLLTSVVRTLVLLFHSLSPNPNSGCNLSHFGSTLADVTFHGRGPGLFP